MNTIVIELPHQLYEKVTQQAGMQQQSIERFVVDVLTEKVTPPHPYIEMVSSRSGQRTVIKGTRTGVDVVVGYTQAGYTPKEIAEEILPHLTLAQVYDALSYYEDHQEAMNAAIAAHTPDAWQKRLHEQLGGDAALRLLGTQQ